MNQWSADFWWVMATISLIGSALYSGLETGIYRLNRVRLQIRHHENNPPARILHRLVHRPMALLSTLLIGNNITNYIGTASLAMILEHRGLADWQVIVVNVLLVTPALLVLGEVLPKDLFSAHSDQLTYPFARFLDWSQKLFWCSGLLPLTEAFSNLTCRLLGISDRRLPFHPRRQVELMVKEGVGRGLLSDEQSAIVERVLELDSLTIADEMVPWEQVSTVRMQDPATIMWDLADRTSYARFPVIDDTGAVRGVIRVNDALVHDRKSCPPLTDLMTAPLELDAEAPLRAALTTLQSQRTAMAMVTRQGNPVGIVTVKDLVEPIIGELASW